MNQSQQQPQTNPWRSRLIGNQNTERQLRIQEGRARHRAETAPAQTQKQNGRPLPAPDIPPPKNGQNGHVLPEEGLTPPQDGYIPVHIDPQKHDLGTSHREWTNSLAHHFRSAREADAANAYPETVAGKHLEREAVRLHRMLNDTVYQSHQGFQDGLADRKPHPPNKEPYRSIYQKGYASGHEAAQAQARRQRNRARRRTNTPDEQGSNQFP